MAENSKYQPGAEDYKLAQDLNRISQTGEIPGRSGDELSGLLLSYKNRVSLKQTEEAGIECWQNIENAIRAGNRDAGSIRSAPVHLLSNPYLKAAAVLLTFLVLSLIYLLLPVQEKQYVAVSSSEKTEVILHDGSLVTLRPHSTLLLLEESDKEIIYQLTGEGYFDVVRDQNRTFSVIAESGRIDVLGTRFTLSTWSNDVRVFLEEGRVRFSEIKTGDSVELMPGEFSNLTNEGLTLPVTGNADMFTAWLNNEIYLDQRPLAEITMELSHHYDITIEIPDELMHESLSGTIFLDNLNEVLDDLALSLDGEFIQIGENSYRFRENP
jgi:transmembrane sensor